MKRNIRTALIVLFLLAVATVGQAQSSLPGFSLMDNSGFKELATKTLSLASDAATIVGTLPVGAHNLVIFSERALNYGGSSVSTSTAEPFIATTSVEIIYCIKNRQPSIYLRPRGTDGTATATLYAF